MCESLSLTALWSSQNDIQDTETVMEQGTYTVTKKKESCLANRSLTLRQEYSPANKREELNEWVVTLNSAQCGSVIYSFPSE